MIGSSWLNGGTRPGRAHSWRPGVALLLVAALTPFVGATNPAVADPGTTPGWDVRPPVQVARAGLDVATVNGTILAAGGFDPSQGLTFSSVEARRTDGDGAWLTVAPMPTARANVAVAAVGRTVYAVGGFNADDEGVDVVERFDSATGAWSSSTRLPAPRGAAGAAALGDLLYVAGGSVGLHDDEITASVLVYSPIRQTWTSVAPMPTARWRLRLVAAGGHLYAIGGQSANGNTLSTVERYDPKANTWTTVASMNQDRGVPGAVAVNHGSDRLIVVVGGCQFADGQRLPYLRSTEVYNVDTDQWHLVPAQLPSGRCSLGVAVDAAGAVLAISGGSQVKDTVTVTREVDALTL